MPAPGLFPSLGRLLLFPGLCRSGLRFTLKTLTFILSLLGLALLTAITAWLGVGHVLSAMQRIGVSGFAALVLAQLVIDGGLGVAWFASCPELGLIRTIAARAVRDAAGNCLPFSQLGGMAIGIRATCGGVGRYGKRVSIHWPEAVSTNIVDITTEVLGQIAFILVALLCLLGHQGAGRFIWPVIGGMGFLAIGITGFIWTQQRGGAAVSRFANFFGKHIAESWRDSLIDNMDLFQARLDALWARPGRIALGAGLHFLCWIGSAGITWLAFTLLGAHLSFPSAIAIEGVVCGIMSASFLVPASLGVQEAAYVTLGIIFGIDAKISLGLSLLRRGRDIAIGIPVIAAWQILEMRRLRREQTTLYTAKESAAYSKNNPSKRAS